MIKMFCHAGLPVAKIKVPENSVLTGGDFGYPIISAMNETILHQNSKDEKIEVITISSEGQDVDCIRNDEYMKSEVLTKFKIGFVGINISGNISDQIVGLYDYMMNNVKQGDTLVLDVSLCDRYTKMVLIMAAYALWSTRDVSYMVMNSNGTCDVKVETEKYTQSAVAPIINLLSEVGLIT